MRAKTLLSIAVASTLGVSAAAYAGPGHSQWVAAGEEQYPAMVFGTEPRISLAVVETTVIVEESVGSTASSGEGSVAGSFGSDASSEMSLSSDELSSLGSDDSLALADQGIYSDFIVVSYTPIVMESWDLYIIETQSPDELAMSDEISSTFDLAASESDFSSEESVG